MNDLDIIKQLMNGNHLNDNELERAYTLTSLLKRSVDRRINTEKAMQEVRT